MIRAHFGLAKDPFSSENLTLLAHQREVLETLRVHCQQGGLCVIVGEPGTGKSVIKHALCRCSQARRTTEDPRRRPRARRPGFRRTGGTDRRLIRIRVRYTMVIAGLARPCHTTRWPSSSWTPRARRDPHHVGSAQRHQTACATTLAVAAATCV